MKAYMIRRILNLLPTLLIVSMIVFAMIRILPGDPIYTLAAVDESDGGEIDPELYARLLKEYDLDKPIVVQYGLWMSGVFRGDWGTSLFSRQARHPAHPKPAAYSAYRKHDSVCDDPHTAGRPHLYAGGG